MSIGTLWDALLCEFSVRFLELKLFPNTPGVALYSAVEEPVTDTWIA